MKQDKEQNGVHILGQDNSYRMFTKSGCMKRNVRVHLDKGVRVVYHGCGMNTTDMVVYDDSMNAVAIYDGDTPEHVEEWEADNDVWQPNFRRIGEHCRPLSEVFGIGDYYDESGVLISDEVIEKSIAHARAVEAAKAENKRKEEEAWNNAVAKAKKEYSHILTPLDNIKDYSEREKVQKRNLMALLKHEFPGVKFTGRKGYQSMTVRWTDGPCESEVNKVLNLFEDAFDGDLMTDYYHTTATPFTSVFGGWDSVCAERKYSEEFTEHCKAEAGKFDDYDAFERHVRVAFNAHLKELDRNYWWRTIAKHTSAYEKPNNTPQPQEAIDSGAFSIVDYSEKSFAVIGDTKSIKDKLKELGGRFNARLSCGVGWIFSKKKEEDVRAALSIQSN